MGFRDVEKTVNEGRRFEPRGRGWGMKTIEQVVKREARAENMRSGRKGGMEATGE